MKVFVTGATGFIGSRVTALLLADGHQVAVLVRSSKSTAELQRKGIRVVSGELESYDVIRNEAVNADAVVRSKSGRHCPRVELHLSIDTNDVCIDNYLDSISGELITNASADTYGLYSRFQPLGGGPILCKA